MSFCQFDFEALNPSSEIKLNTLDFHHHDSVRKPYVFPNVTHMQKIFGYCTSYRMDHD